nr:kelch repeat-containing protein [Leptospira interrogans]
MGTIYKSCYSFSETENVIQFAGDMNFERTSFAMHLLNSGKVLIAGGTTYNNILVLSMEIYDPTTKTFTIGAKLNIGRVYFASAKLNNGNVLFLEGIGEQGQITKSIEVFNPMTNTVVLNTIVVEKLILYGFSLYGNGRLKRFVNCCYGIFQQL